VDCELDPLKGERFSQSNIDNIIVLEDSSQSVFGGGQKITISVCKVLNESCLILMADYSRDNEFQRRMSGLFSESLLLEKEEKSLFNLVSNIIKLYRFTLGRKNALLYCTTNRGLFYGWVFSFIGVKYIYHAHLAKFKLLIRLFSSRAEKVICVSEYIKEFIGSDNCFVVSNPA